jgi:nucleotide-binding universal stress UspA family protein
MYRILVAVGTDVQHARRQADCITGLVDSDAVEITLAHAYPEETERDTQGNLLPPDESDAVRQLRATLEDSGLTVQSREVFHPVAEGVLDLADDLDVDLLVVGARRRSPVGKAVFGSVTQTLLLDATIPVVVVGSG